MTKDPNLLGSKLQEKYYQRAIEIELEKQEVPFKKQKLVDLVYEDMPIGRYFIDFVIDDKVALEIKASDYFKKDFSLQVLAYLKSAKLKLGIIANFNSDRLLYKRLINSKLRLD